MGGSRIALLLALVVASRAVGAQAGAVVSVVRPAPDSSIVSATPRFTAVARDLGVPSSSVTLELQVATSASFEAATIVFDDTMPGDSADFIPARPLPSGTLLWWRALARADGAITATSALAGPRRAPVWVAIVAPDAPNGIVLEERRPRFTWTSAPIVSPPGPWRYNIDIAAVGGGDRLVVTGVTDTTFVPPRNLEANTGYRWSVTAIVPTTGDSLRVASQGSFVISSPDRPLATLLYQNFPNPFPTATAQATCIWFDLERAAQVEIEVLTLRGDRVRTLYPVGPDSPVLPPGRYGRADVGSNTGCNPKFSWDGRSDDGREVSPGVYLLRLRVAGRWETRKIVFNGR